MDSLIDYISNLTITQGAATGEVPEALRGPRDLPRTHRPIEC